MSYICELPWNLRTENTKKEKNYFQPALLYTDNLGLIDWMKRSLLAVWVKNMRNLLTFRTQQLSSREEFNQLFQEENEKEENKSVTNPSFTKTKQINLA